MTAPSTPDTPSICGNTWFRMIFIGTIYDSLVYDPIGTAPLVQSSAVAPQYHHQLKEQLEPLDV